MRSALESQKRQRRVPNHGGTRVALEAGMDTIHALPVPCHVPVLYATSEGQTRRIAMRLAEMLRTRGIDSRAIDISSPVAECLDWSSVRASIVGASLHVGRHQPAAAAFVRTHASALNARPSVFLSVSLSAASKQDREVQTAKHLAEAFPAALGWHPERVACLAGRLAYTKYGPITRVVMQLISWREGGPTDTSRDYELTDWGEVDRLADEVTRMAAAPAPGVSAA